MQASQALERLLRLEGHIAQDPANEILLAQAHEAAVQACAFDKAQQYLQLGRQLCGYSVDWQLREAASWIAQKKFAEAKQLLLDLQASSGSTLVIAHELASIAFQQRCWEECRQVVLKAWAQQEGADFAGDPIAVRLCVMWLRASHQLGRLDEALHWVVRIEEKACLHPDVAAVASLIAIDSNQFGLALRWSQLAIRSGNYPREAFNARAALALAQKDIAVCKQFASRCLEIAVDDGRAWSTLGLAFLLERDFSQAVHCLEQAVNWMPQHIGSWHALGWAHVLQSQLEEALQAFDQALGLDRNFSESHGGRAVVLALAGRKEEARQHADVAVGLNSAGLSAQFARALLNEEVLDSARLNRLAQRLLGHQAGFFGETVLDWVQAKVGKEDVSSF